MVNKENYILKERNSIGDRLQSDYFVFFSWHMCEMLYRRGEALCIMRNFHAEFLLQI